jgi:hypothetical protein
MTVTKAIVVLAALASMPACAIAQPSSQPADTARAALEKVAAQKSYRTKFAARIEVPNSDPMNLAGENVVVNGGVLFITYRASGGETKRIVRAGNQAWVYHELAEEWVTAEEAGMGGAGRGVQNPEEVLAVLGKHLKGTTLAGASKVGERATDEYVLKLSGDDIEAIVKEQAQQGSFNWKESSAEIRMHVGSDALVYRFSVNAELISADDAIKGQKVRYAADVEVQDFNASFAMPFVVEDPKTKTKSDLPLDAAVIEGIAARPKMPAELAAEVEKLRSARIATLIADLGSKDFELRELAESELKRFGKTAVPALKKALDDKDRAESAKKLLAEIDK